MPAQPSFNPLLSGGQPPQSRASARGGEKSGDFRQLVENRRADQKSADTSAARAKGGAEPARSRPDAEPNKQPASGDSTSDTRQTGRANDSAPSSAPSDTDPKGPPPSAGKEVDPSGDGTETGETPLEQAKALLASLSEGEQNALTEDLAAVLEQLRVRSDSGELAPETEAALDKALAQLENGADLDKLVETLAQVPLDGMPQLAERFAQARNLGEALGRRGAAYLKVLAARAGEQTADGAQSTPSPRTPGEAQSLSLAGLDQTQSALGERSGSRPLFEALLGEITRTGESGPRAEVSARPMTDLRHNAVAAEQLARADSTGRSSVEVTQAVPGQTESRSQTQPQPLAPGERQFTVQSEVRVPVGQSQWGQAVGQRIAWMASQRLSSAELRLDPPDLGPLQVKVNNSQDQISVTFTSAQPAVREALDQNAARLREMFANQGLDLVDVNVSDHPDTEQQGDEPGGSGAGRSLASSADGDAEDGATRTTVTDRLVDHYV